MIKDKYLTISVDDGYLDDLRTSELLSKYGLKATFYIPRTNPEREVLAESAIKIIAQSFEIGGHTYSHKPLVGITGEEARKEVGEGKDWLEQLLGRKIIAFCYPRGKFNASVVRIVKNFGFSGARTCMYNLNEFPQNPYLFGLSTHAHCHSRIVQIRHAVLEKNFRGLMNFFLIQKGNVDWVDNFKSSVEYVEKNGGIAHLYLHSWEISYFNEWERLEELFRYLSGKNNFKRVTNGELFNQCSQYGAIL